MATQKPISTISYNTESFLREKLDTWLKGHIIQAYQYICHKGEDGDKDHIHLRIEPNKKLDPMELTEHLKEYRQGSDKPLGVRPWRPSKEEDWTLYVVHEPSYLSLKYQSDPHEKLPYDWHDIKVSEGYDMETNWVRARAALKHSASSLMAEVLNGSSAVSLIQQGESPYLVNSLLQACSGNDYTRLTNKYNDLDRKYREALLYIEKLKGAINQAGCYPKYNADKTKVTLEPLIIGAIDAPEETE